MFTASNWMILGSGGHARSLASIIRLRGDTLAAIASLNQPEAPDLAGVSRFENDDAAISAAVARGWNICIGVGSNAARENLSVRLLASRGLHHLLTPLIARTASIDTGAVLGPLVQVAEHAHVGPGVAVEQGSIINTGAIIEHDAFVGAGTHIAPGSVLLGAAKTGKRSFVGSGARLLPGVEIGDDVVVGAGAVVTRSVEKRLIVAGVPARPINKNRDAI